ncbi:MAG TPA: carboxylesterase/lipase family protein, partial [Kofleriaceae bacterium]|nr:carboxylesterase/lipase family protein [Kofleriaceae bacterium]
VGGAAACGDELGPNDVEVETGVVRGSDDGAGVKSWLGIPYAAPPVGELRWKPPKRAEAWDGARDGTKVGQKCPQNTVITSGGGIEDCLTLNVWAPSAATGKLPVMFWIHGGAFVFGSGGDPFYSGAELARTRGVVVVTINYRLGGLGFLAHPALAAEDPDHTSGNYGLRDQLAALEWVQRNIGEFGGDPGHVTIFGESAGGFSGCVHYTDPKTAGLFERAIVESGACLDNGLAQTRQQAESDGLAFGAKVGCPGSDAGAIACMRDLIDYAVLDATALAPIMMQKPGGFFYDSYPPNTLPNVDGVVIPEQIEKRLSAGDYPKRPIILGTNKDEGTLFHSNILSNLVRDETQYREALMRRFNDAAVVDQIVARYPVGDYPSPNEALAAVSGDVFFTCPARRNARALTAAGSPVYRYVFQRDLEQALFPELHAFHSAEIPFVFGIETYPLGKVGSATSLADAMQSAWTSFAKTGEPGGGWPKYEAASDPVQVLDVPVSQGAGYRAAFCDFWDTVPR